MISKLKGEDLLRFAKLNQKSKDKRLSIKMTTQEWQTLKQLSELNGTPMSQQMRRAFFTQNVHLFQGVSQQKEMSKTSEVVVRLPTTKLNEIKRRQKKKGLSDGVYIVLALDDYLTTIEETYFI